MISHVSVKITTESVQKINKTVRLDVACLRQVIDKIDYLTPVKDKQTFS